MHLIVSMSSKMSKLIKTQKESQWIGYTCVEQM